MTYEVEQPLRFAILNFNDSVMSRHHTAAATLRSWRKPGPRYGWSIREIIDGNLDKRVDTQDLEAEANWDRHYS